MPQLNPSPWFFILVFSWLIFLLIIPAKVAAHVFPNELVPQTMKKMTTEPWAWPW
uniref:ATP synthase complex subunit 8 n=1 Tax=Chrysiptera glauca TaxID=229119 RepID=Q7Y679_9TELE|nr:ATP synthase 8 [Chrysiptera glauca]AAP75327.1 ATP synthase 8 [Chrysiptera glauca]